MANSEPARGLDREAQQVSGFHRILETSPEGSNKSLRLKTNQYAIAALKDRRATLAGEIESFKQGITDREEMLSHLDATLRALDPSYRADTIAPKRLRRMKLFGGGS